MGMNERAVKAINAMKDMGIDEKRVKPVLKNLLRLFDRNWQLIEDDHYTLLVDAIFEEEATKTNNDQEQAPPLKKMCLRSMGDDAASASAESNIDPHHLPIQEAPPALPRPDEEEPSQLCLRHRSPISPHSPSTHRGKEPMLPSSVSAGDQISQTNIPTHDPTSPQPQLKRKQVELSSPQMTYKKNGGLQTSPSFAIYLKEPKIETGVDVSPNQTLSVAQLNDALVIPKTEPPDDYSSLEVPIAIMPPINSNRITGVGELTLIRSNIDGDDLQSMEHDQLLSQVKEKDVQEALSLPLALSREDEEEESQLCLRNRHEHHPISPQSHSRDKGNDPPLPSLVCHEEEISQGQTHTGQNVAIHDTASPQTQLRRNEMECSSPIVTHKEKGGLQARPSFGMCFKKPKVEPGIIISRKEKLPVPRENDGLTIKSEPPEDYSLLGVPTDTASINFRQSIDVDGHSTLGGTTVQVNGVGHPASKDNYNVSSDRACESVTSSDHPPVLETPLGFEIASSTLGEVKISLICGQSFGGPGAHVPSVDEVLKAAEDKCLRSFSLDPSFSIKKLFEDTCQTFLDFCQSQR